MRVHVSSARASVVSWGSLNCSPLCPPPTSSREKLERDFGGEEIPPDEAVENFAERTRANVPRRLLAWFERRFMGKPVGDGE